MLPSSVWIILTFFLDDPDDPDDPDDLDDLDDGFEVGKR